MADGRPFLPGGVPSAQVDGFARDNLPPKALWPRMDYATLPELSSYASRINAGTALVDAHVAAGRGSRPAIYFEDKVWSYGELKERSDRLARVLVEELGLVPGNRVLLRGPNNPMMAAAWLAVLKAGGISVATMPLLRARELAFIIDKAAIGLALCDTTLAEEMEGAKARSSALARISYFSKLGCGTKAEADLDRRAAKAGAGFAAVDTAADDVALIAFTSGTTGEPKGTVHFHRDVMAMCDCFPKYVFKGEASDIYTGSPPLAFTFGLGAMLCFPLSFGAATVLLEKFTPDSLLATVERYRVTTLYTAPTGYRAMTELAAKYRLSSLRKCVSAGETLPLPTFEGWRAATGLAIIDGLGSTEMLHIFVSASGAEIRPGATGKAIPGYEAAVVDDDGNRLPPGKLGNLAVWGPTGCRYLANLERQKAYVRAGWNFPGDVYVEDEDGYFHYQARADDMIISAGYNISGPEVEAVLLDHPKVRECAVVASPDAERGFVAKAFVVLREAKEAGPATAKELQAFVKREIAPYKYPRAVEFVEALPRTETGKVQRFKLRQSELARTQAKAS
ncbi:MAG: AMP-binding protein [Alphaproteobacteria bacterium]